MLRRQIAAKVLCAAGEVRSSKRRLERRADDRVFARDPVVTAVVALPAWLHHRRTRGRWDAFAEREEFPRAIWYARHCAVMTVWFAELAC